MRLLVIFTLIIFSFYAQSLINKRKQAEEEVKRLNEGLEHLVIERTAQLETANRELKDEIALRRQAEETLKDSERKYRDLVDNAIVGVYQSNINGAILYVNDALTRMFEFESPEEMISGGALARYRNPKDREVLIENLKRTGKVDNLELEVLTGSGKIKNVLISSTLDGEILSGMVVDITERKQAEQSVRKSEEYLRSMLQTSASAIICLSSNHKILEFNSEAERLYGRRREDVLGKDYFELFLPKEVWDGVAYDMKKVLAGEPTRGYENPIRAADGTERILKWYVNRIPVGEEQFGIMAVGHDVTELKRAQAGLEGSYSLLRATLESTADGILVVNREGKMVSFNKKFVDMWHIPEPIVASRDDDQALAFVLDQLKDPEGFLAKVRELYLQPDAESYDVLEFKNGRIFDRYSQPQYIGKESVGRVWSFRDVTERSRAEKRLVVQYAVTRVLAESATLLEATPRIIQAICETIGWDMGAIWIIDRQANLLRCLEHWHIPSVEFTEFVEVTGRFTFAPGIGMPGRVWATNQPAWIIDVTQDTNFPRAPYAAGVGLHSAFGFPIKFGDEFLGVIEFFSREIRQSDEAMLRMFAAIGSQIGQFMMRKQTEAELEKNYNLLDAVFEGTTDVVFVKDLKGSYLMINFPGASLIGRTVEDVIGKDDTELFAPEAASQIMEDDRRVMSSGETRTYEEELLAKTGIKRTYLTTKAPFLNHLGKVAGIIGIARDITERKEAEEQIRHLAYYDVLTDLPNRLMLRDEIDRAITAARKDLRPFALLVLNINRFKEINNTLGFQKGDVVLQQVGKRLRTILPEAFSIARTGGDEFGILILNTDANIAVLEAEKISRGLEEPVFVEGFPLDIAVSVGIALFPGHGEDADTLIKRAHIAMDTARKTESGYAIYRPEYDQFIPERLVLMGELRHAIEENQLFLLYQPKIDLKTGKSIGVEALVRWQHPETGLIPPDKFISLAEESGLIKQLTFWVLREALRQSRSWSQAGIEVPVAVNLSIKNLQTPLLLDQIRGFLSTWGVDPSRLRFEVTESTIMSDPELAMEIITQLTFMGVRFSIDDFGTGYSSLKYLQRLPVDEIKIDKSFIMNMMADENSMKIVYSTIELAHSLGLKVVAEGVENQGIFDKLGSLGCDAAQGYFISKPILHAELTDWMGRQGKRSGGF